MPTPLAVQSLVDRFDQNLNAYRSGAYNETQIRIEFIDPFFEALGWDVHNRNGYAEAYKDVIHQDAVSVEGRIHAPDYCFRIGGARKFFLEAKKPSISIKDAIPPAYQLRRYAWSAKLVYELYGLTDEEIRIVESK
jgi:predicted type IV restriction endonuclease